MKKVLKWIVLGSAAVFVVTVLIFFYNTKIIESHDVISTAPISTKFIDIGSEKIAYREIDNNASKTVIFVGGLSAWNGTWERVVQELNKKKKDLNYIAIDLPPFGYSSPSDEKNYFRDTQAGRIESFMEKKKLKQVVLVAHSYGAGPATEYVMGDQNKVEKLIIIAGVLNIDEKKIVDMKTAAQVDSLRIFLIGVLAHNDTFALSRLKAFVNITEHVDQDLLDIYTRYFNTKNTTTRLSGWFGDYMSDPLNYQSNFSSNYKKLTIPVRLIWGDKDTVTPISGTKILLESLPNVTLTTLNDVGHIPMIEDHILFDRALLDAIDK